MVGIAFSLFLFVVAIPTPSVEEARAWLGRAMIDRDGKQLGEITDSNSDRGTDRPEWAVVRTGLFGLRSSFVLLARSHRGRQRHSGAAPADAG